MDRTPSKSSPNPPNHDEISNSTNKKFSEVVAQYMRVHKISSLNPTVMTQAADHTGLQGDSYHQWDEYNPPTPISKVLTRKQVTQGPMTVISMDGGEEDELGRGSYNSPKTQIDKTSLVSSSPNSTNLSSSKREHRPSFNFLPSKHCLQLPSTSRALPNVSMNSFWEDYERTTAGKGNSKHENSPIRDIKIDESEGEKTPSVFSNSVFEIDSIMEPDSLEKKPISPSTSICERSVKKSKTDSSTVAGSCLPQLLMLDYTESPPYMPTTNSFSSNVTDTQSTWQRGANNCSSLRTSIQNIQLPESSEGHIRNSFAGSSRNTLPGLPGSVGGVSHQPSLSISTPTTHLRVFDSLADTVKRDQKKRRNICIGLSLIFIGALIGIISLAILVRLHNKKFAPYNGMYPNGLNSTAS